MGRGAAAERRSVGRQRRAAASGIGDGFGHRVGPGPPPGGPADGRERSGPPDTSGSPRRPVAPAPARCEDNWSRPVERFAQHPHTVKARPRPGINRHVHVGPNGRPCGGSEARSTLTIRQDAYRQRQIAPRRVEVRAGHAEEGAARRERQLLQTSQSRALCGSRANALGECRARRFGIGSGSRVTAADQPRGGSGARAGDGPRRGPASAGPERPGSPRPERSVPARAVSLPDGARAVGVCTSIAVKVARGRSPRAR